MSVATVVDVVGGGVVEEVVVSPVVGEHADVITATITRSPHRRIPEP